MGAFGSDGISPPDWCQLQARYAPPPSTPSPHTTFGRTASTAGGRPPPPPRRLEVAAAAAMLLPAASAAPLTSFSSYPPPPSSAAMSVSARYPSTVPPPEPSAFTWNQVCPARFFVPSTCTTVPSNSLSTDAPRGCGVRRSEGLPKTTASPPTSSAALCRFSACCRCGDSSTTPAAFRLSRIASAGFGIGAASSSGSATETSITSEDSRKPSISPPVEPSACTRSHVLPPRDLCSSTVTFEPPNKRSMGEPRGVGNLRSVAPRGTTSVWPSPPPPLIGRRKAARAQRGSERARSTRQRRLIAAARYSRRIAAAHGEYTASEYSR